MVNSYTTAALVAAEIRADTAFSSTTTPTLASVQNWIEEESKMIEIKSGQVFGSTVESSIYFDYDGSGIFRVPKTPVISITGLEYNVNSNNTTSSWVTLQDGYGYNYLTYKDEGEVEFIGGANATNKVSPIAGKKNIRLTYTYGYSSTPLEIQKLCSLLVAKRVILTLINSQGNTEGGDIQVGTIRVSDPSNYSLGYLKSMNQEIDALFSNIGQGLNTFRMTRNYD